MPKIGMYAGHGGADPGAVSGNLKEKDFTLQISNAATKILKSKGYEVINNRQTDTDRSITRDANRANAEKVDGLVEIHLNSSLSKNDNGTEGFYSVRDTGKGKELAGAIVSEISKLGIKNRGIMTRPNKDGKDDLGIIRLTNAPTTLIEVGFINNDGDVAKIDPAVVGKAVADGVMKAFPIKSQPQPQSPPPQKGDPVVRDIQKTLNTRYNTKLTEDGIFGKSTKTAIVKGLQTELNKQYGKNLTVDGVFGASTKAATVPLRRGASGNITYLLQAALYGKGYKAVPDGVFGEKTHSLVVAFQNDNNLPVDGIAGRNTQELLFGA